jgi:multiple antibiotic resistance protein
MGSLDNFWLPWSSWLSSLISILVIVDPVGVVPLFLVLTHGDPAEKRRAVARRATGTAFFVLTLFTFTGDAILRFFGITVAAFRVAGGIILLVVALGMLQARQVRIKMSPEEEEEGRDKEDVAIVPLGVPALAGPGAITTVVVLTAGSTRWLDKFEILSSIFVVMTLTYGAFHFANPVASVLGRTGMSLLTRLLGLLLAVIAVQFTANGLGELFPGWLK